MFQHRPFYQVVASLLYSINFSRTSGREPSWAHIVFDAGSPILFYYCLSKCEYMYKWLGASHILGLELQEG